MGNDKTPNCFKCEFFFITWDAHFSRGCNAYEFKSKELPSSTVLKSTGKPCLFFKEKKESETQEEKKL